MWFLYPFLVTFVVVATGNHYFIDAFLGAMTAGIVGAAVAAGARSRAARAWSFRRAEAEAAA